MSTCRVTSLNSTATKTSAPPAKVAPPVIEPAAVFHTEYEWNSAATRIRCAHEQCSEVIAVPTPGDIDAAEELFAVHRDAVLGAIPVELAALRSLKAALPVLLADLSHGVPVLRIEADLFRLLGETDEAIGSARELLIETAAA